MSKNPAEVIIKHRGKLRFSRTKVLINTFLGFQSQGRVCRKLILEATIVLLLADVGHKMLASPVKSVDLELL